MARKRSNKTPKQKSPKWKKYQIALNKEKAKDLYKQIRWRSNFEYSNFLKEKKLKEDKNEHN